MTTPRTVCVYITRLCREQADERIGINEKKYLLSYAAEQWQLRNIIADESGGVYMEMPPRARDPDTVIWAAELDGRPLKLVLLEIGPRDRDKRDGFSQYVAEICGRFVGGVIGSMTS